MRLTELCVYAKVRSSHDARRSLRTKTSHVIPTSAYGCDHLILTQKQTQSSNSYSNSKQKQANEGLQI